MKIDFTLKMCISFLLGVILTKWVFPTNMIIPVAAAMVVGLILISVFSTLINNRKTDRKPATKKAKPRSKPGKKAVQGTVKWFNREKGFGFIEQDGGGDVFVHYKDIEGSGRRFLRENQRVTMTVIDGEKGPQAVDVSRR